jgi:hypothetical protein
MEFTEILISRDANKVRVITAALKAHGFHPLEGDEDGIPGLPGVTGLYGISIRVPAEEAADARVLAEALDSEMRR